MSIMTVSVPVSNLKVGDEGIISLISGGKVLRQKLYDIGVIPGEHFKVIHGAKRYPYVLEVNNTRCAFGAGAADSVFVTQILDISNSIDLEK